MKHSNRVKVQRLLRILKVRCILLLHDYRAGLPDQNKLWFRHTLSFDDVRQPNSAIWRKIRNEYIFLLKCDMARTRIQNSDFSKRLVTTWTIALSWYLNYLTGYSCSCWCSELLGYADRLGSFYLQCRDKEKKFMLLPFIVIMNSEFWKPFVLFGLKI